MVSAVISETEFPSHCNVSVQFLLMSLTPPFSMSQVKRDYGFLSNPTSPKYFIYPDVMTEPSGVTEYLNHDGSDDGEKLERPYRFNGAYPVPPSACKTEFPDSAVCPGVIKIESSDSAACSPLFKVESQEPNDCSSLIKVELPEFECDDLFSDVDTSDVSPMQLSPSCLPYAGEPSPVICSSLLPTASRLPLEEYLFGSLPLNNSHSSQHSLILSPNFTMHEAVASLKTFLLGLHITTVVQSSVRVAPYKRNRFSLLDLDLFLIEAYLSSPAPTLMIALDVKTKHISPPRPDLNLIISYPTLLEAVLASITCANFNQKYLTQTAEGYFRRSQASGDYVLRRSHRLCEYYHINPFSYSLTELELKLSISILLFNSLGRLQYVSSRLQPLHFALMTKDESFMFISTRRFGRFASTFVNDPQNADDL